MLFGLTFNLNIIDQLNIGKREGAETNKGHVMSAKG
jgi:hypothetical protein